jgi:hypothetical protein
VRVKELPFFFSWWTALVPGGVTAAVTLVVLVVRAALEGRAATLADVVSALAVGLIVGAVGAVVPFVMVWRMRHQVVHGQFGVGPESSDEPASIDFPQFDDSAGGALTRAQDEARRLDHGYMGTEHLLLGLLGDPTSVASQALANLGVEIGKARTAVEFIVGRGDVLASGEIGLTPRAKRVIELGLDEARRQGGTDVRSEHLLLGLLREGEGIAAGVIELFGVGPDQVREEVRRVRDARDRP